MRDASKWSWLVENLSWMACAAVLPIGCATQGIAATSPTVEEQNQAIARRWSEELWGQGRLATADEIIAPDYVRHDPDTRGYLGLPATGKMVRAQAIQIFRLAGGKIVESWAARDDLGVLVQLGHLPAPGTPALRALLGSQGAR